MSPIHTYPARSIEQNVGRMKGLWQAELQRAGIDGDAEVHYEHRPQEQREISFGEFAADQFFGRVRFACEHAYVARLSGTSWPTGAAVTTSNGGRIGVVKYVIHLPTRVDAPLAFEYGPGQLGPVKTFSGHDAERLNRDSELRSVLASSLSFGYQTGVFDQGSEIGASGYIVEPTEDGCKVTIYTTVQSNPYAPGKPATLGLAGIYEALKMLDAAIQGRRENVVQPSAAPRALGGVALLAGGLLATTVIGAFAVQTAIGGDAVVNIDPFSALFATLFVGVIPGIVGFRMAAGRALGWD